MFLWCGCHCERGSVSEVPPSQTPSSLQGSLLSYSSGDPAAPDPPTAVVPCAVCMFGTAPQVYEFEWTYGGKAVKAFPPRPCCSIYSSQKKYRLYARPAPMGECVWSSNEKMKKRVPLPPFGVTANCQDGTGARVVLRMFTLPTARPRVELSVYYEEGDLNPLLAPVVTVKQALYVRVDANGSPVTEPFEKIPCLQQQRFRAVWAINNQPAIWVGSYTRGGVPFGSPCDQDSFSMIDSGLPEYVTATPVPA